MAAGNVNKNKTGNGATITVPGLSAHVFSVGEINDESAPIEDSDLSNVKWKSFVPGDLEDPGTVDVEIGFKGDGPALNTVGTINIQYPDPNSTSGGFKTLSGSGFVYKKSTPSVQNGQIMKSKIGIRFDGKTVIPAWS